MRRPHPAVAPAHGIEAQQLAQGRPDREGEEKQPHHVGDELLRGDAAQPARAGALAQRYTEMGGEVRSLGKPDPAIYPRVFAMLGLDRPRILAVGDALRTDIAGARGAGIASAWVLGGIHAEELGLAEGEMPDAELAAARAAADGLSPEAVIPAFRW